MLVAALVLRAWMPSDDPATTICLFRRLTHHECATCGMTRALALLVRGDWAGAFARHPLAIPLALEAIALKAMSKDPADRYQTAGEMADVIEAATKALGDDARSRLGSGTFTAERTQRERKPGDTTAKTAIASAPGKTGGNGVAIAGVALVALLAIVGWLWSAAQPSAPEPAEVG